MSWGCRKGSEQRCVRRCGVGHFGAGRGWAGRTKRGRGGVGWVEGSLPQPLVVVLVESMAQLVPPPPPTSLPSTPPGCPIYLYLHPPLSLSFAAAALHPSLPSFAPLLSQLLFYSPSSAKFLHASLLQPQHSTHLLPVHLPLLVQVELGVKASLPSHIYPFIAHHYHLFTLRFPHL